jgi:hypothetical protein
MKRIVLAGVFLIVIVGAGSWMVLRESQMPPVTAVPDEPYDTRQEIGFEGTVVRIDPPPCTALPFHSYHLHLRWKTEIVEVHLGTCAYAVEQKLSLKVGDRIRGTGVIAAWRSGPRRVVIGREVRRGGDRWLFRDASGQPLWRSHHERYLPFDAAEREAQR